MRRLLLAPGGDKDALKAGLVSPYTANFYGDYIDQQGQRRSFEFDVVTDRARLGDQELGIWIKRVMDVIQRRGILPYGGREGRFGTYVGFTGLWTSRWFRPKQIVKRDFNRGYDRFFAGRIGAG